MTIVEDDDVQRRFLYDWLRFLGHTVVPCGSVAEFDLAHDGRCYGCDALFLDLRLPDGNGMECLDYCLERQQLPRLVVVMTAAIDSPEKLLSPYLRQLETKCQVLYQQKPLDYRRIEQLLAAAT